MILNYSSDNSDNIPNSGFTNNEKQDALIIYNQIKNGCKRNICYNIFCKNNLIAQLSKLKTHKK